jgi:PAS domain S-box-containing protein
MDITAQKRAEEALRSAHDDLEQRVRDRTQELEDANELMMLEVLERRRAEAALRDAEEKYRLLVERLPAVSYIWDLAPTNEPWAPYTSPQIEDILGYTQEEWMADPDIWHSCLHPDDREAIDAMTYWGHLPGGQWSHEYRLIAKDGRVVWIRDSGRAIPFDDDGTLPALNGVLIDITAEKENEKRVRVAEERYRTLVEQIPAISYIDALEGADPARGHTIFVSPQVQDILGYTPEELIADPDHMERLLHPDDLDHYRAAEKASADGTPFSVEFRVMAHDGRFVWLQSQAVLVRDDDGQPRFWHGIALDITARKRAEEELRDIEAKFRAIVDRTTLEG